MEMKQMMPDVRKLFLQVEQLVRLLVCPVTSCEAENNLSSSASQRLKTCLRNIKKDTGKTTKSQDLLEQVDNASVAEEFATKSATRENKSLWNWEIDSLKLLTILCIITY